MNRDIIEKLRSKLTELENQDVFVKLENSIQYYTTIKHCKIIISDQKLIISDSQQQDFIVELYYLEDVEIDSSTLYLKMSNDIEITLDY